jgi:hypothetical protein
VVHGAPGALDRASDDVRAQVSMVTVTERERAGLLKQQATLEQALQDARQTATDVKAAHDGGWPMLPGGRGGRGANKGSFTGRGTGRPEGRGGWRQAGAQVAPLLCVGSPPPMTPSTANATV